METVGFLSPSPFSLFCATKFTVPDVTNDSFPLVGYCARRTQPKKKTELMHFGYFLRTRADATFPIPSDSGFHLIHHGVKSVAHTSEKRKQQGEGHHVAAKSTNDKSVHSIQIKSYVGHRMTESFSKPDRNHNHHNLGAVYSLMRIWARSGIEFQRESS